MERSQLIYVVTVAECGSVTRAAEKLHLSQPSLSNQIIHLEQELGIALFARVRKRVHLTEAGEVFVRHAQRILNDMQALAERMEDYAANRSGRVRIGALPIMCALHIPELIGGFHSEYPSITLTLQEREVRSCSRRWNRVRLMWRLPFLTPRSRQLDRCTAFHCSSRRYVLPFMWTIPWPAGTR